MERRQKPAKGVDYTGWNVLSPHTAAAVEATRLHRILVSAAMRRVPHAMSEGTRALPTTHTTVN